MQSIQRPGLTNDPGPAICATCGVEAGADVPEVCPICADERQWVPASGQRWTTLRELAAAGVTVRVTQLEDRLWGLTAPGHGIAQTGLVVRTPDGVVLWDPPGFIDDEAVAFVLELGTVRAVVASHPHMYGVQVEWARALDSRVLVNHRDRQWLQRDDERVDIIDGTHELAPDLQLHRLGGHFAGSQVLEWRGGAAGSGTLLSADTIMVNPDLRSTSFMRSYPNRIPLSPEVTMRLAEAAHGMAIDRCINNFGMVIVRDARAAIMRSAERQVAWMMGRLDEDC